MHSNNALLLFDELGPNTIPCLGLDYKLSRSFVILQHTCHLGSLGGALVVIPELVCRDDADGNTPATHFIDAVGIVGGADNLVFVDIVSNREFLAREREACEEVVPVLRRRKLVGKDISHEAALHPVVNEPTVPLDLVHHPEVAPGVEVLHGRLASEEVVTHLVGFSPRLRNYNNASWSARTKDGEMSSYSTILTVEVPEDVMVFSIEKSWTLHELVEFKY